MLGAVAVASAGIALLLYATEVAHEAELSTVDARFSIRGEQKPRDDVVMVLIDDTTSNELNIRFPYPRSLHARVIDAISADGPKAIAYDVEFIEPTTPRQDNALITAVGRAGPDRVVLADTQPNPDGESGVFGGQQVLEQIGARAGNTQIGEDSDGVRRRIPYAVSLQKTFPVVTAETVLGEEITEDDLGGDSAWIDFAGPPDTYPSVPFSRVLDGKVDPGMFAGKIVVVGASDPGLKDIAETSTTGDGLMSGPEIEANAIATALEGFPLQSAPLGVDLMLIMLMGLVAPMASFRLPTLRALALALAAGALYLVAAQIAFGAGRILPVLYPMLALALAIVGSLAVNYLLEAYERQRVRDTFSRFVPEQVVGQVLARTDDDLRLGGQRMVVTVLFSDIRGFTTFSETRSPEEVFEVLNRYHEEMTEAVMDHGGTLISFMGDGIMAVHGAPIEQGDHADRALATAIEMLEVRLPRFNAWMRERGGGEEFRIGIGLNSGPVMAGNVGSRQRLDYTTIGDTVNTAARLEGMTKGTEHQIFLSDSTRELLSGDPVRLAFVDSMPVRGRAEQIKVWAPVAAAGGPVGPSESRS
ncbi:MAG: adenylate/guanylate cyclase domain-containing protein [Solirubrobacterales bacterium]|nr:adenylate/guanylate cyclase domain-containing protein [Solirubrobacterales bacterium]